MRWFKHMSLSQNDETLSELMDEFGAEGYGVWWIILEKIAQHMDETNRCFARFSLKVWANSAKVSAKKFQNIVRFLEKKSSFILKYEENYLTISCPNLLKYRDEWTERKAKALEKLPSNSGVNTGDTPGLLRHDPDTDTDTDTDNNTESTKVDSCSQQNAGEPAAKVDDAVIKLLLKDNTLYPVPQSKIETWQEIYSNIDVMAELEKIKAWLLANPKKRNTRGGMDRRINLWLSKSSKAAGLLIDKKLHDEIKQAFEEILPINPINAFSKKAEQDLQERINENPKRKSINFWRDYFLFVKCASNIKQHEWHLDYLVRDQKFSDIINCKRHTEDELKRFKQLKQQNNNNTEQLSNADATNA